MKRVLFVTTLSGFLAQFEMNQVRILQNMGYEVHYASNYDNKFYEFDEASLVECGVILHPISIKKKPTGVMSNTKATLEIRNIIDDYSIDVVHCNNPLGGVCGRLAARISKRSPVVIYTAHGFHFYKGAPLWNWLFIYPAERFLARYTDVILTINKEDYRRARRFKIKDKGFVFKLSGMGVDVDSFKPMPELRHVVRKELGIPDDAFHIVTSAELNDNKNQRVIIEALAECPYKNIYFSLCGIGDNKQKLEQLIHDLGLEDRVKLLGYRTDMERVLQSADVFAFPSIREGLGIAAVEALECNVPVIASDNRGTREFVKHKLNGIVCKNGNAHSYMKAIMCLYENPKFLKRLSTNARESVKSFSVQSVDNKVTKIYKKVDSIID